MSLRNMDGKFLCRTLANGIQQYVKTMTKQGLFQNPRDGWISGNQLRQFIRTISTAPGPGQQGQPSWHPSRPAFPKG